MYETEAALAEHRRDLDAGNVLRHDPGFNTESAYMLDGSDLYIASVDERLDEIDHYVVALLGHEGTTLKPDVVMIQEAENVMDLLQEQLDELSDQDKLFAHGVQDWVLAELHLMDEIDGKAISGMEEYRRTITVLEQLLIELHEDNEDEKLIGLAETWRKETLAELDVAILHRLYELAA